MKKKANPMQVVAIRLPPSLKKKLDAQAKGAGIGPSVYLRRLVLRDLRGRG